MTRALTTIRKALLALLILVVAAACAGAQTADGFYSAGVTDLNAGRVREALQQFQLALRMDPNHVPSLIRVADLLSANNAYFQAWGVLERAARIAPDNAEVHALRGRTYLLMHKFSQAREELLRAVQLDPSLTDAYYSLAASEAELGRFANARQHIEAFLQKTSAPRQQEGLEILAHVAMGMKDYDAAAEAYRHLLGANPNAQAIKERLAETLVKAGRYQEAEEVYQELATADPRSQDALRGLFQAAYDRGAYQQAVAAMQRFATLNRWTCEPWLNLARAYRRMGRFDDVRRAAQRCLEVMKEEPSAYFLLGYIAFQEGNFRQAGLDLKKALEQDPGSAETLYWLGATELKLGETDIAVGYLEKAIALKPDHASAHYTLAQAYARSGKQEKAAEQHAEFQRLRKLQEWSSRAVSDEPASLPRGLSAGGTAEKQAADYISFANYLLQEKKPQDALQVLEESQTVAPSDPEILRLVALAHSERGDVDAALRAYAEAEKVAPSGELYLGRGSLYLQLNQPEAALADLQKAVVQNLPTAQAARAHLLHAAALNRLDRHQEAADSLQAGLAADPDNLDLRTVLGSTVLDLGKPDAALEQARWVLERDPGNGAALLVEGRALTAQGALQKASESLDRAAKALGDDVDLLLARARLAEAQNEAATAIKYLQQATQQDPARVRAYLQLGELYLKQNQQREAALEFEKAIIIEPGSAPSLLALGKLHLSTGDPRKAAEYLRRAVTAAPGSAEAHYQLAVAFKQIGEIKQAAEEARQAMQLGHPQAASLLRELGTLAGN